MDPYAKRFDKFKGMGNVSGPSAREQKDAQQASGVADVMRLLGGLAPAAGTGIGAIVGGPAGAAIGGALGQVGGGLLSGGADMATRKYEDADLARREKLAALMGAFGGRR